MGRNITFLFDRLQVEQLLASIEAEPRYGGVFHPPGGQSKGECEPFLPMFLTGKSPVSNALMTDPDTERSDKDVSSVSFPVKYPP